MKNMRTALSTTLLAFVFITAMGTSIAHMGAKGVVKERMEMMKFIGKAMKSMGRMARGKAPLDPAIVVKSAGEIADHGQRITILFPKGSGHGVSEASPRIWEDPNGFRKGADRLVQAARILQSAAKSNDVAAIKTSLRALGKSCGGCHKQFRIKKKK